MAAGLLGPGRQPDRGLGGCQWNPFLDPDGTLLFLHPPRDDQRRQRDALDRRLGIGGLARTASPDASARPSPDASAKPLGPPFLIPPRDPEIFYLNPT
jgi:hypothetical protein